MDFGKFQFLGEPIDEHPGRIPQRPCGCAYDPTVGVPDSGAAPGTPWEQVPDTWLCPICGVGKDMFEKE